MVRKLEGNCSTPRGEKKVWRNQNHPSWQCQGDNHRAPGCPCHSALHLPGCHKSVLPVCNCISKCNTHFLPCGDIFIPVFKAGSSVLQRWGSAGAQKHHEGLKQNLLLPQPCQWEQIPFPHLSSKSLHWALLKIQFQTFPPLHNILT